MGDDGATRVISGPRCRQAGGARAGGRGRGRSARLRPSPSRPVRSARPSSHSPGIFPPAGAGRGPASGVLKIGRRRVFSFFSSSSLLFLLLIRKTVLGVTVFLLFSSFFASFFLLFSSFYLTTTLDKVAPRPVQGKVGIVSLVKFLYVLILYHTQY